MYYANLELAHVEIAGLQLARLFNTRTLRSAHGQKHDRCEYVYIKLRKTHTKTIHKHYEVSFNLTFWPGQVHDK